MRTLALIAAAAAAVGYTPYPLGTWGVVECREYGCERCNAVCNPVYRSCNVKTEHIGHISVIFVNSTSHSGTSSDAFAIKGKVHTKDWAKCTNFSTEGHNLRGKRNVDSDDGAISVMYDAKDLKLLGQHKGLLFLSEKDAPYTAECADESDGPVTLVQYIVNDRCTNRAIVDCNANKKDAKKKGADADKKDLLDGLRDDPAVNTFLNSLNSELVRNLYEPNYSWFLFPDSPKMKSQSQGKEKKPTHVEDIDMPAGYMEPKEGNTRLPVGSLLPDSSKMKSQSKGKSKGKEKKPTHVEDKVKTPPGYMEHKEGNTRLPEG